MPAHAHVSEDPGAPGSPAAPPRPLTSGSPEAPIQSEPGSSKNVSGSPKNVSGSPKNIVICLDGTNNKVRGATNTNVLRLYDLLDLSDPDRQVAYYSPGVGTFASPAAWSPPARALSRLAGLAFGAGLRQNLGMAYSYLMSVYQPGDAIYVFGFSRGAYTARALTGMLEVFGIFRRGAENLVPYAVSEYARQLDQRAPQDWAVLREYARVFGGRLGVDRRDHAPVHFVGLWDTVKAAGTLTRQLRWPFTRQLPHAEVVRHAVAIDEWRGRFVEYLVEPARDHLIPTPQDLREVWFPGIHSDVGGVYATGTRLSDIPMKWMVDEAMAQGLLLRPARYRRVCRVNRDDAVGALHTNPLVWIVLGRRRRPIPPGALLHPSIRERLAVDPEYARRLPPEGAFRFDEADADWMTLRL